MACATVATIEKSVRPLDVVIQIWSPVLCFPPELDRGPPPVQGPLPTHLSRRALCQMRLSDFSSVQAAQVWTGRAVSAIRSTTTVHSLVKKSSLPDAAVRLLESCSTHTFDLGVEAFDASSELVEAVTLKEQTIARAAGATPLSI